MKLIKKILLLHSFLLMSYAGFAQKQNFDAVFFTMPKGWQQQQGEGGLQLSVMDNKTGFYAIAVMTKANVSGASANENFSNDWLRLVKGSIQVNDEPSLQQPSKQNGWTVISGSANYTDGANKGTATLLTATGGGQAVSVVLMTNTKAYEKELLALLNSLELAKAPQTSTAAATPVAKGGTGKTAIVGLWCDNTLETTGSYVNGFPQYTAGYMRKEYAFYPDGTYLFRNKQWQTLMKDILFVYETGTYSVSGNQLTLTPKQGKGGWWAKGQSTKVWGNPVKTADYKLEKATYVFEIKYFSGSKDYCLILKMGGPTEREGNSISHQYEVSYKLMEGNKSIIDNPPGFKTGFENKQLPQ
ncbi:hypothetical protein VRU48_08995 [Pedobacter sp. KR3-3]|uniref:Uncharacterized protein n=1 Tax=Pedobacter albus TaxID=3113905 RepID=A0ABU7I6Z4_9SPHI|nr:hypothetical protein [Pedobacter sp. KR3-3]MEE1945243.1 hypothetical protein [Pedobacter sp. KR3-3]